jgi:hypothetical protein
MRIFDRLFAGKVIKDFGTYYERSLGIGREKHSSLLVERNGRYWFVLKSSYLAFLGGSLSYEKIPLENAASIRDQMTESEQIIKNLPPLKYDASRLALQYSLITFIVASTINLLAWDSGLVFLITFIAALVHLSLYVQFQSHPGINSLSKRMLIIVPIATMLIAIPKLYWLTIAEWR